MHALASQESGHRDVALQPQNTKIFSLGIRMAWTTLWTTIVSCTGSLLSSNNCNNDDDNNNNDNKIITINKILRHFKQLIHKLTQ